LPGGGVGLLWLSVVPPWNIDRAATQARPRHLRFNPRIIKSFAQQTSEIMAGSALRPAPAEWRSAMRNLH